MRGLDPRIHVFTAIDQGVDGRDKPGHDDYKVLQSQQDDPGIYEPCQHHPSPMR
jgi:hypothetical protein